MCLAPKAPEPIRPAPAAQPPAVLEQIAPKRATRKNEDDAQARKRKGVKSFRSDAPSAIGGIARIDTKSKGTLPSIQKR